MFGLGAPELIAILVAAGILLFGGKKIVGFARSLGRFGGEFKKGKKEVEDELSKVKDELSDDEESAKNKD